MRLDAPFVRRSSETPLPLVQPVCSIFTRRRSAPCRCVPTCDAGWKSCDGIGDNGCETSVTTTTNCVNCGVSCSFSHASATCPLAGGCTMGACDAGFADCGAASGCETTLGTPTNCAACNNACTNAHGGNTCAGMPGSFDCSPTCDAGWKSCNNNPDDGCETDMTTNRTA
jgi:hypothetical protein